MRHRFTHAVHQLENIVFRFPRAILTAIFLVTVFFALKVPGLQIYTAFEDLLPQNHPYIQLHNEIRGSFGGASQIVVALEVEDGTIFTNETGLSSPMKRFRACIA